MHSLKGELCIDFGTQTAEAAQGEQDSADKETVRQSGRDLEIYGQILSE